MKNITKTIVTATLLVAVSSVSVSADVNKGQKLYLKKLKSSCGFNGGIMAAKHSMKEWKHLYESKKLAQEIKHICPKVKEKSLKEKFMQHYFDFFNNYASDSGNIPSC